MSLLTTTPLKSAPSAANQLTVTSGGSAWSNGSWVEFITSAATALQLASITVGHTSENDECEYDIGIGTAGNEVVVSTVRITNAAPVNWGGLGIYPFPIPISVVPTSSRVTIRCRGIATSTGRTVSLQYYENTDSDNVTTSQMACLPSAAAGASVTPNASAWANSSWVQLTSGIGHEISLAGITFTYQTFCELEIELGTGGSGSETVITTVKTRPGNTKGAIPSFINLPAVFPVAASTRIAVRVRKSDTNTNAYSIAVNYYDNTAFLVNDLIQSLTETSKISDSPTVLLNPLNTTPVESLKIQDTVNTFRSDSLAFLGQEAIKVTDSPTARMDLIRSISENLKVADIPIVPARSRITQHSATVIGSQAAATRITQHSASIILAQSPNTRITQHGATILRIKDPCSLNIIYEDPCSIRNPQFWVAMVDENGDVTQAATRALRNQAGYYGGYTEPRLLSISGISRVATDWMTKSWSAQTATAVFADTDRIIRGLTRGDLASAQLYAYLVDDATRVNRGFQRLLFQGPVYTDSLKEDLHAEVTANDVISVDYSLFADEKMIPQRVVISDDFPNCPSQTLGFGVPIIAGEVAEDLGALLLFGVGNVTLNSLTKSAFLVCGHAVHGLDLFQGGVAIPDADPHAWWPYSSTWTAIVPGGDVYVTIGGNDYTLVLLDGWRAAAIDGGASLTKTSWAATTAYAVGDAVNPASTMVDAQGKFLLCTSAGTTGSTDTLTVPAPGLTLSDGSVTWTAVSTEAQALYANVIGFGTAANGTGSEITDGIIQAKYILINWILQSFRTGNWLASPKFESYPGNGDYICRVDTDSFSVASDVAATYLAGGFVGGFVIGSGGQRQSTRQLWANILQSFNLMFCQSQYQQLKVVMLDRRRDRFIGGSTTVEDRRDILASPNFSIEKKREWLCNDLGYQYAPNYRNDNTGSWNSFNSIGDAPSKVKYGTITKTITYPMVRDQDTADAVADQQLDFRSQLRLVATYSQSLCGLKRDVLDGLSITHFGGRGLNGWQENACWITSQKINQPSCSVTFEAIDVQDLISQYTTLRVTCPGNLVRTSEDGDPVAVTYADPAITGGREPITGSYNIASGSDFPVGITGVTYTAVSADGQMASCSFTVTVNSLVGTHHLIVTSGTGDGDYLPTDVIGISADAPPPGQMFDHWTGATFDDEFASSTTLSISVDTTVVAHYSDIVVPAGHIAIGWDPNPDDEFVEGYVVMWGTVSGVYTNIVDVGNVTSYDIIGLTVGTTYYITIQAYNSEGYSGDAIEVSGAAVAV
jgi:hypothetical protein